MNKKDADDLTNEMLIADALLRLKALENVLVAKGLITREEFAEEMNTVAAQVAKSILQKAQVPGNIDEIIKNLQDANKKDSNN